MGLRHLNLLLADNDTDDCFFFKTALDEYQPSTHLTSVHDGEQLMELLSNEAIELPDALFLDLNMPRKNGFECLSEIKLNKRLQKLPVIIYSTSFEQYVVHLLYKKGALYFIPKPSDFVQFTKIIHRALTLITQETILQPTEDNFVLTIKNDLVI